VFSMEVVSLSCCCDKLLLLHGKGRWCEQGCQTPLFAADPNTMPVF
jgi:hypothetical protein